MRSYFLYFIFFTSLISFAQEEITETNVNENEKQVSFAVIEDIPIFPGCENVERAKRLNCFNAKMNEHIKINFIYPKKALKRNIEGKVFIKFIINKEGNVVDVQTKGADPILQTEARRIFALLPKMTPGKQRGKNVNVMYSMPLNFKLQ